MTNNSLRNNKNRFHTLPDTHTQRDPITNKHLIVLFFVSWTAKTVVFQFFWSVKKMRNWWLDLHLTWKHLNIKSDTQKHTQNAMFQSVKIQLPLHKPTQTSILSNECFYCSYKLTSCIIIKIQKKTMNKNVFNSHQYQYLSFSQRIVPLRFCHKETNSHSSEHSHTYKFK